MQPRTSLWTLDELGAQVALALASDYPGAINGRIRDVPDRRTIRYYQTLGLVDPPAAARGRTALYGLRHLMQLVAIKRLQTHGLTLAQVQERLVGLSEKALRELARLPAEMTAEAGPKRERGTERETPFWKAAPAARADTPVEIPAAGARAPVQALVGVPLADGVTLLVAASRALDEQDLEALRTAAAPLLRLLVARHVLSADRGPTSEDSR
jgi:DNA-binding transcriptional MerR regulator